MAKEEITQCGAGQYWKRENQKGSVWAYAARKTWVPKEYHSGTCATKAEVVKLLKQLEKNYRLREFSSAASYFTPTETEAAYRKFLDFEDKFPDFKADRPTLDQMVEAGLSEWRFSPNLRAVLKGGEYRVSQAYQVFVQERKSVIKESLVEEEKLLKFILKDWWNHSIFSLYAPPKIGEPPSRSVKNQLKTKLDGMRRKRDGNEYSEITKLKAAKRIKHFFRVVRDYYSISDPNPAEDLPSKYSREEGETPKTVNFGRLIKFFRILKNEPRYQPLIPYAAMYWFSGRRPSDIYQRRRDFGHVYFDYSYFDGFGDQSILADGKGCRFYLPAKKKNPEGVVIRGTKSGRAEEGELSESGLLWMRYYFEELLGERLPTQGPLYFSRYFWGEAKELAGWDCTRKAFEMGTPNAWVQDVGRHTYNTAARLYYPRHIALIASLAGHSEQTFKDYYKNPRLKVEDARIYFEDIRPDLI